MRKRENSQYPVEPYNAKQWKHRDKALQPSLKQPPTAISSLSSGEAQLSCESKPSPAVFCLEYNTHPGYKCLLLWIPMKIIFNMNQLPTNMLTTWIISERLQHSTSGFFPELINKPKRLPKFFISVCFGISSAWSQSTGFPLPNCPWCGLVWNTKLKTGIVLWNPVFSLQSLKDTS